ncbi:Uncharacterized protein OS=Singulisphaera acidiphila (strain ATCC BAA-1392 / DSM 18658 / VKM B-2454 / MOB10) GN=Sinac_5817 PE=4 SV=1 [Gemmata massiliana]|uniref:Uncharacterized protein n=1 Tax=Gemmata massiliana TaxID=1210884 RepID=A0A6P2DBG5_9BACT|nr:hypothetical protein [Gemmata massiliana]VTR97715.1 Uncharacterized protein OS=Singulisphaera acidiphila (strain ATCC BAA-1392 / DSM 18658 / VKM B-2454 / MOB10) GN=Sinac_5817 PE=4 SV=1 [Gemmata massiliana]
MNQAPGASPLTRSRFVPQLRKPVVVQVSSSSGSRTRRRALRTVLWGAVALLVANAVLSVSVETALPQVRDPEYGYRLVRTRAQQRAHPDRPLVLVVGTSRTQNVIDPSAMEFPDEAGSPLVFNFGQSGARPPHLRLTLQRLFDDGVRPAAVVVEILPGTLAYHGSVDDLFDQPARLTATDLKRLEPYLDDPAALRRRWLGTRVNSWEAFHMTILSHLAPELQPWRERVAFQWTMTDAWGFSAYPQAVSPADRERKRDYAFACYGPVVRDLRVSELAERAVRDLVSDCRAAGVPVAFYLSPESPIFQSWYSPESRSALGAFARMLSDELKCPVFDAPTDFAEEDFADGHHALRRTAARFSRGLADRHLRPWLESIR